MPSKPRAISESTIAVGVVIDSVPSFGESPLESGRLCKILAASVEFPLYTVNIDYKIHILGYTTMPPTRYLTAKEAAALLSVKEATLYAYVSRGLIRSQAVSDTPRQHLYLAEDVQQLAERKAQRRDPAKAARDALHWGTPMLDSALTLITEQTLYYRGYDAVRLAQERTLEEVAALLWTGEMDNAAGLFATGPLLTEVVHRVIGMHLPPMQGLQVALALASAEDLSAYDLGPAAVLRTGARILW